jgi:hypothetical protein
MFAVDVVFNHNSTVREEFAVGMPAGAEATYPEPRVTAVSESLPSAPATPRVGVPTYVPVCQFPEESATIEVPVSPSR